MLRFTCCTPAADDALQIHRTCKPDSQTCLTQLETAATAGVVVVLAVIGIIMYEAISAGMPGLSSGDVPIWSLKVRRSLRLVPPAWSDFHDMDPSQPQFAGLDLTLALHPMHNDNLSPAVPAQSRCHSACSRGAGYEAAVISLRMHTVWLRASTGLGS